MSEFRFKENRVSEVFGIISIILLLGSLVLPVIIVPIINIFTDISFVWMVIPFFISLLPTLVLVLISNGFSGKDEFTKEFLEEIKLDLNAADNLDKLWGVRYKLWNEAVGESVERGTIRLSYPLEIKGLLKSIDAKIEILTKIENKSNGKVI